MRFGLEYVGPIPSNENIDRQDDAINATSSRALSRTRGQEVEEVTQGWRVNKDGDGDPLRLRARKAMALMTTLATKPWRTPKPC